LMAMYEELEIEIDETGAVRVTTKGLKGEDCLAYVGVFRELLGDVVQQRLTSEYYETPPGVRVAPSTRVRAQQTRR
jgi:hypothetical protein